MRLGPIFISVLLVALPGCGSDTSASGVASDPGPLVEVVEVRALSAPSAVIGSGLVGYRREADLAFNAPGVIAALRVDSGDRVRRGQTLATLRRTSVGSNADEAALARANAERDLARTERLHAEGFVSDAQLEDARLAVERARDSSVLVAPADGVILRRYVEPSQSVGANSRVLAFGETGSGIVVRAPLAAAQAARVRVGDAASVRVRELAGEPRRGRVARIGAQGDLATGAFEVEIAVANSDGFRSGMVASVEIEARAQPERDARLLAPALSLLDARADQGVVYVVDEQNIARRRSVRTDGITSGGVLIVEGLSPGERVIAAGAAYARDGAPVRIAEPQQ
jgi:RND family efflux transporter MFP subunit